MLKTILQFSFTNFNILTLLYYTIWFANIICVIKEKKINFIQQISILFILLVYCGNTFNGDYCAYYKRYKAMDLHEFEIGFRLIGEFCKSINLPYNVFISLLVIPLYYGLIKFLKKTSNNLHLFFALYFTILYFYDVGQVRNFIIAALVTLAISCLIENKKLKAFLLIICASLFHHLALVYFPLIVIKPKKVLKYKNIIYIITFGLCCLLCINGLTIPFLGKILFFITKDENKLVYGTHKMRLGFIVPIVLHLLNVILVFLSGKIIETNKYSKEIDCSGLILWSKALAILGCLTFPLIIVDLSFDRIVRNFSYLFFSLGCVALKCMINNRSKIVRKRNIYRYFFIFFFIYIFLWDIGVPVRYGTLPPEKYKILHNNVILMKEDNLKEVQIKPK